MFDYITITCRLQLHLQWHREHSHAHLKLLTVTVEGDVLRLQFDQRWKLDGLLLTGSTSMVNGYQVLPPSDVL